MEQALNQKNGRYGDKEVVTLGGGCFWCLEAVFDELRGVDQVEPGYSGGIIPNPTYQQVCTGQTNHAEAVQITFDPKTISLRDLLEVFFRVHDPTTLNRQGSDVGTQYRSVIFFRNERQKSVAEQVMQRIEDAGVWNAPIVTELAPFTAFFKAETYHERYFNRNGEQPYCRLVIAPKMAKFREYYRDKLKKG